MGRVAVWTFEVSGSAMILANERVNSQTLKSQASMSSLM